MIEKQRLKELIEQGATIYVITTEPFIAGASSFIGVQKEELSKENNVGKDNTLYWKDMGITELEYLYETEEDARWELEMTATRTETLKLPKWEEFYDSGKSVVFRDAYGDIQELNQYSREIYINGQYCGFLTKENYIEACKLCLRLFKGEEV